MPLLEAVGLAKRYGAVRALTDGRLTVEAGQIHALLGANGCGKSTLCKVIAGAVAPNEGSLRIDGRPATFSGPREAERAGIGLFYQELSLVPQLSVEENLFLGHEPRTAFGFVDRRRLRRDAEALIGLFSSVAAPALAPGATLGALGPDLRQIVEILKIFARRPRIMIMDEATAALDGRQAARFFEILRAKKVDGVSTIMISHRLDEVFAVCDRITIMRNGGTVAELDTRSTDRDAVVRHMIGEAGRPALGRRGSSSGARDRLVLDEGGNAVLKGVSFSAAAGEIVGLGGLQGQGQSALLRALFGAEPLKTGALAFEGRTLRHSTPRDAVAAGFAYVSGDRGRNAALPGRSIFENLAIASIARDRLALVSPSLLKRRMTEAASSLQTKFERLEDPIGTLSGGNQQKIFIARWLATHPHVVLLDDPTKGIDLGAKADLFGLIRKLADGGATVLFYSSEDAELLDTCDRILVFNGGALAAELVGERMTGLDLTRAAYGEAV